MPNLVIGVDVDGVLANFSKGYAALIVRLSGRDLFQPGDIQNPPVWDWDKLRGYTEQEIAQTWEEIKISRFWSDLAPFAWTDEFLTKLSGFDPVYFITDRPGKESQFHTSHWLDLRGYPLPSVVLSRTSKGDVCRALKVTHYIDDKAENIESVVEKSPETQAFLLDWAHNRHCRVGKRITHPMQFLEALRG